MKCPVCKTPLLVIERESIEVDWCAECHGIWFDVGELAILAEKAGKNLAPDAIGEATTSEEARRRCPRCRHKMEKVAPAADPELLLDRCPEHGLWFDADELGALMRHLPDAGGEEATVIGFLNETFSASPEAKRSPDQRSQT
jgi:Zn-finger nucleic acid-binding protein